MPKEIYAVWLSDAEVEQITAIYEKTGALATVMRSIRAAKATKLTKGSTD